MVRITKPTEIRKQEIIETALGLFQEKGYENTTIQDIAERMNVAQGLCYRYFKSKQEIFSATSDFYAASFVEHLSAPITDDLNIVQKFNLTVKRLLDYGIKHEEFESTFKKEPEISFARLQSVIIRFVNLMIPIVEQGVNQGIFQCDDVQTTVKFLTFGIANTIHSDMPSQNAHEHILAYAPVMADICRCVLKTDNKDIGMGWDAL
ncbi:MAG: TetR/AcrR family transcriptional regulator [Gracilibacteraceae bacterium]|jgi:AcrR family transcriptional regulator|nr:TetR/AcrR family transcriptional regulator [Gracilibacteraceae bacterium]